METGVTKFAPAGGLETTTTSLLQVLGRVAKETLMFSKALLFTAPASLVSYPY